VIRDTSFPFVLKYAVSELAVLKQHTRTFQITMGSNYSKATVTQPAVINEKQMIVERHDAPKSDKPSVEVEQALSSDNITRWTNELEEVGSSTPSFSRLNADQQDTTLALSRLVLSQVDPVAALASRKTILHDEKIFNLNLKGLGPNGEYPGPRVNQYSSGRCWLFATSTSTVLS
jgi:predicted NAD/FAD-binding protein